MSRKYFKGNFSHQASGGSDGEFDDVDIQQLDWVEGNRKVFTKFRNHRVSQKKCTNRMLLEPWCTGSTTSGWHHLTLESVFLVVSY